MRGHNEELSRALFRACDRDADDRLSILEAAGALLAVHSRRDVEGFRRLDTDADGYLHWPEFDARYRQLALQATPFQLHPSRPFEPPAPPPTATSEAAAEQEKALAALVKTMDANGDGVLQTAELVAVLKESGVPPALLAELSKLDADSSGDVQGEELQPLVQLLPQAATATTTAAADTAALPSGFAVADADGNGALTGAELREALRRLDPSLTRWTDLILRQADRSGNGSLGIAEVQRALAPLERDREPPR